MYNVALIQNQSEMSHYGYADARPLLSGLGYEVTLYTGQNIENLIKDISTNRFDGLIIASHALNDKTIVTTLNTPDLKRHFLDF